MKTALDHIVIGAATVAEGVAYLQSELGATLPAGGEHPRMGTHNHLMQLSESTFLEIIAINPAAPAPARPRWFGLDEPFVQAQLRQQPRLLTWVVNTGDLAANHAPGTWQPGVVDHHPRRWPSSWVRSNSDCNPVASRRPSGAQHGEFGLYVTGIAPLPSLPRLVAPSTNSDRSDVTGEYRAPATKFSSIYGSSDPDANWLKNAEQPNQRISIASPKLKKR